jgi:hypothetical protein
MATRTCAIAGSSSRDSAKAAEGVGRMRVVHD